MSESTHFYIGYDSLEEWERQAGLRHPSEKTVYLMPVETITSSSSSGFASHELAVIVTQLAGEHAHYLRMIVANLRFLDEQGFEIQGKLLEALEASVVLRAL